MCERGFPISARRWWAAWRLIVLAPSQLTEHLRSSSRHHWRKAAANVLTTLIETVATALLLLLLLLLHFLHVVGREDAFGSAQLPAPPIAICLFQEDNLKKGNKSGKKEQDTRGSSSQLGKNRKQQCTRFRPPIDPAPDSKSPSHPEHCAHTHAHTHAHTYAHTHARTRTF